MAPRSTPPSHPGRYLAALVALLVVLLVSVLGVNVFKPSDWHKSFRVGLGLDLSSGTSITLKATAPNGGRVTQGSMTKAIQIMTNRVEATGLTGASVVQQGTDEIVVSVPGAGAQKVASLVGETALLRLRQVLLIAPNTTTASTSSKSSSSSKPKLSTTADGEGDAKLLTPATVKLFNKVNCAGDWKQQIYGSLASNYDNPDIQTITCYKAPGSSTWEKYALDKAVVQGNDLSGVAAVDQSTGWVVTFNVKSPASKALGTLTTKMASDYYPSVSSNSQDAVLDLLAVVLDGSLQGQPPQVTSAISDSGQINGGSGAGFTQNEATTLANVLKYGSLPLSFHNLYTSSVSASLGSAQLSAGLFAAMVGLLLVVIYSFTYYRGLGVVSVLSLAIAASVSYMAVVLLSRYEGFTLDLAGIAGLIVAIGITADSFIVYFERLRDEVREGRSLRAAVEHGWTRARRTILVSDTVSFLAALLLYILSEGDVRGFAFTLGLTTIVDVVVVFLFTKPMVTLLARTKFYGQGHPLSGLDPARLGARAPWRGSRRPPASRTAGGATATRATTSSREA